MKDKGKKSRKLSQRAQEIAEQIAYESAISNTLLFCMERGMLCYVRMHGERWTQKHVWRVLNLSREFVYVLRADAFRYEGYELHRISDLADIAPAPELTEHYHLIKVPLPQDIPEVDPESLQSMLSSIVPLETLVLAGHIGQQEDSSREYVGHFEKLGKKKLSLRTLDPHDLAWSPNTTKLAYEDLDYLIFRTPTLYAFEKLAMPYDAYIRSLNEAVSVPLDTEEFEVGTDLLEEPSEDLIDFDEIAEIAAHAESPEDAEEI